MSARIIRIYRTVQDLMEIIKNICIKKTLKKNQRNERYIIFMDRKI